MIRLKTGALFGASVESAALCAGINQAALSSYTDWGVKVGECFQALDDIDDGDRPTDELSEVLAECGALRDAAERLNPKLIGGATSAVLNLIVTPPSFTQTALHDTSSR